jgi:mannose-6-phosphate isomerase
LHLKKGEGIFQPAGLPHAYLEGQNVEVMANSDNVLRAGLTDKYIDVPELMKHVVFEPTQPLILTDEPGKHRIFNTPAGEFELHRYQLPEQASESVSIAAANIFLVMEGRVVFSWNGKQMTSGKGQSVLAFPGTKLTIKALSEVVLFRVNVPGA